MFDNWSIEVVIIMGKMYIYLMYIPGKEKAIIFGVKWFKTEWKPSRQLVCSKGDACMMPLVNRSFVRAFFTLS